MVANTQYRVIAGFICTLIIAMAGCGENTNEYSCEKEHYSETTVTVQNYESHESETDDWGLSDITELFETWGWHPSSNPTNIEEIAQGAGQDISYIAAQKEKIEQILISIPQVQDDDTTISFRTDDSRQHFGDIEWEKYHFDQCEFILIDGKENGVMGRAYLRNNNETWKESNTAIFLSFIYLFETQKIEMLEVVETTSGIVDYRSVFEYEEDGTARIHTEEGLRLLDMQVELNPVEAFVPVNDLEGEELELYVETIFLDIYRCPDILQKYTNVFDKKTYAVLESVQYYYDEPKNIYDFANTSLYTETRGTVYLGSQFQASLLETVIIELHIDFEYDTTTGKIVVTDATMCLVEKP